MQTWKKALSFVLVAAVASATVIAQDAAKLEPNHYKVLIDNASVRVLKVSYAAGEKGTMHSHPDAIVVSLAPSKVRFTLADGKSQDQDLAMDAALYTPKTTHSPANLGTGPIDAIVVEFKASAPGKAVIPTSRPELKMTVLADGPHGLAYRSTASPTFAESPGTTHEFDQVVIALGPAQMPLSIEGKLAKTNWVRGDAVFVRRGIPHAAQNTGGKPVDFILVSIR